MADKKFNIIFDVDANIGPVKNAVSNLQSALSKINVPDSFKKGLTDTFTKLDNEIKNFESIASKGFTNLADVNKAEKSFDRVTDLLSKLRTEAARLKGVDPNKLLPKETIDKTKALHSEWIKLKTAIDKGFGNTAEIAKQNQELDKQNNKLTELQGKYNDLAAANKTMGARRGTLSQSLDVDTKKTTELVAKMQELEKVKGGNRTAEYKQLSGQLEVLSGSIKRNQTEYDNLGKKINENKTAMAGYSTQITSTENTISQITTTIEQLKSAAQQTPEGLTQLREKLAEIQNVNLDEIPTDIDAIGKIIQGLNTKQIEELRKQFEGLETPLKETDGAIQKLGQDFGATAEQAGELTAREKEIEQLANRVKTFFSIGNTVQLFKRAVKSAIDTVKELDEVMTQAAVVTKFDVSGMWAQLPEYTKRANELGVTVKGVYEASTLYYQQGLETEQVIGVTNETLKMAKIAGLDYATATNYMTSALRGFNMEVNELSAQKVNDIYSQLAAKTASNVEEISIAMSKVAPLAHNAGMEIETTAAMLAQMIEKTREAPETLGTAMKTVIARFQELKKDPALIEPIDGEMVDANKVETALNTIGVALRDTSGQFRQLDDVFLEISQKWDTLDINTQRYIATIAAGSRQQSRFIAMMADYARTTDLVNLANNSAGASAEQFEKTQASLATALNRLKNAWDQFAMGLANNQVIKIAINLITGFINTVNKAINKLSLGSGLIKSILNLGALLGGIKLARAAFNGFFGWLLKTSKIAGLKSGTEAGAGFGAGFTKTLSSVKKIFSGKTWIGPNLMSARVEVEKLTLAEAKGTVSTEALNAAQATYNNLLKQSIAGMTLNNEQRAVADFLVQQGVDSTLAEAAALSGLTDEEALSIVTKGEEAGIDSTLITKRLEAASAAKVEEASEEGLIKTQQMGLLTRLKYIAALLFGSTAAKQDAFAKLGMAGATYTATAAQEAFNASIYACPIGWIIAAIAALVAILVVLAVVAKNNSLEARMERAAEATKNAKDAAQEAKDAYDQLLEDKSKYTELQQALEDLTYGTQEWKQALIEANQQVLELLKTYPELAGYLAKGAYGQLTISETGWDKLVNEQAAAVTRTNGGVIAAQKRQADLSKEWHGEQLDKAFSYTVYTGQGSYEAVDTTTRDALKKLIDEGFTDFSADSTQLQELAKNSQLTAEQLANAAQAVVEYNNAIAQNEIQTKNAAKAFATTALSSDLSNSLDNSVIDNITTAFGEKMTQEAGKITRTDIWKDDGYSEYNQTDSQMRKLADKYKDKIATMPVTMGSSDFSDMQAIYAAMSGQDLDKVKETYKKGNRKTKIALAQAIADLANSDEMAEGINEFAEQFPNLAEKAQKEISLAMSEGTSFLVGQEVLEETDLEKLYNANKDTYGILYETFDDFKKAYELAVDNGQKEIEKSTSKLDKLKIQLPDNFGTNLDAGALSGLTDHLIEVFEASGSELAGQLASDISNITAGMDTDTAAKFATILNSLDWKNADNIEQLSDRIEEMGLDVGDINIDGLEQQIISLAKAARTVDLEKLEKQIRGLGQIAYDIGSGKQGRGFSEETKNTLVEEGIAKESDFVFNFETGEFTYLGGSMDSLRAAIIENTKALTGKTKEQLDKDIASAETAKQILDNNSNAKNSLKDFSSFLITEGIVGSEFETLYNEALTSGQYKLDDREMAEAFIKSGQSDKNMDWLQKATTEQITEFINSMRQQANSLPELQDEKAALEQDEAVQDYMTRYQGRSDRSSLVGEANKGDTGAIGALKLMAINAGVAEEAINSLNNAELATVTQTYEASNAWGLETEQLTAVTNELMKLHSELDMAQASQIALQNILLNTGLKEITETYEDWTSLIDENSGVIKATTSDDIKIYNDFKKSITKLVGINGELSDSFWDSAKNIDAAKRAAEGDKEAIEELQKAAASDYLQNDLGQVADFGMARDAVNDFVDFLGNIDIPQLEAGVEWKGEGADQCIQALNDMAAKANLSATQMEEAAKRMGFDAEVDYIQTKRWIPWYTEEQQVLPDGRVQTRSYEDGGEWIEGTFPVIKTLTSTGSGGGGVSESIIETGQGNGGKKGGGGGGGNDSEWENPYDKLYNITKQINGELRIREQLEKRYQRLLNTHAETGKLLKENIDQQIASLERQNELQEKIKDGRLEQIKGLESENSDLLQYAHFDETIGVGGEVQIDWDLINEVADANNEELGKRIEDFKSKIEEWADSRHEAIDAIEDNTDTIIELQQTGKEEYKDLEDRALDAIINHQQNLIDEQEKINNSINEANEALTDAISKNIEKIRQDRQNQETETSLAEKERRLAYLRQDTTGSNAVEIKKLEKDLEKERQNYTDSLIDQSLNDLKEQNDAAAKQREKQIELMQSQLDEAVRTGAFADQATDLVKKVMTGGFVDVNSELYKLLVENEDYYKMTNASRKDWFEQLQATIAEAFVYSQTVDSSNIMESMISAAQSGNLGIFEHLESQRNAKIRSQGLQDEWPETNMYNDYRRGRTAEHTDKDTDYMQKLINSANSGNWSDAFMYAGLRDRKIEEYGITGYASEESFWKAFKMWYDAGQKQYLNGGLADFTGPAWLDGTKSRPEMVLNARDTQNFLELRDILSSMAASGTGNNSVGNFYCDIDINVGEISNDYDVDRIAARIKQSIYEDSTYRNVNAINFLK